MAFLRGRISQVLTPAEIEKEGYLPDHFLAELAGRGLSYVVLTREDCPRSILRRIVWIVRHRKEDSWGTGWSWPIITKTPIGKVGDVIEVKVEPVFEKTELWYQPTGNEASFTAKERLVTNSLISLVIV